MRLINYCFWSQHVDLINWKKRNLTFNPSHALIYDLLVREENGNLDTVDTRIVTEQI